MLLLLLSLPEAWINRPYHAEPPPALLSVRCLQPIPAVRWIEGALPPGLVLSPRGRLEGVPTQPGDYAFSVEVSDGCARRREERRIRVSPAPILTAEAERLEFECIQGAPPFSGGLVRISGSAPGRPYEAEILDAPWLQATLRDGQLAPAHSALEGDVVRLTVNPARLAPGSYTARLRVSMWEGANAPELRFRLRVNPVQSLIAPPPAPPPVSAAPPNPDRLPPIQRPTAAPTPRPAAKAARPANPAKPKPAPPPAPATHTAAGARSRVLPYPKVVIPDAPYKKKPSPMSAPD